MKQLKDVNQKEMQSLMREHGADKVLEESFKQGLMTKEECEAQKAYMNFIETQGHQNGQVIPIGIEGEEHRAYYIESADGKKAFVMLISIGYFAISIQGLSAEAKFNKMEKRFSKILNKKYGADFRNKG